MLRSEPHALLIKAPQSFWMDWGYNFRLQPIARNVDNRSRISAKARRPGLPGGWRIQAKVLMRPSLCCSNSESSRPHCTEVRFPVSRSPTFRSASNRALLTMRSSPDYS
jgi:hypothetical protein